MPDMEAQEKGEGTRMGSSLLLLLLQFLLLPQLLLLVLFLLLSLVLLLLLLLLERAGVDIASLVRVLREFKVESRILGGN